MSSANEQRNAADERYRMENPYEGVGAQRRRRRGLVAGVLAACAALAVAACVAVFGFGVGLGPAWESYADVPIAVSGLGDDFTVTAAELAELPCTDLSAEGAGKAGTSKSVAAYGPTLATFLAEYGYAPDQFGRVIFFCEDGYTVVVKGDDLDDTVVLSIAQGTRPLEEWQRPLRVVVPSQDAGTWGYAVTAIEFQE